MPFSEIHLENMHKLARMGATIMPASPGFYQRPQSVADLVDFVVARVLDLMGIENALSRRWIGMPVFEEDGVKRKVSATASSADTRPKI